MRTFQDSKADTITIVAEAQRVVAWALLVPADILTVALTIYTAWWDAGPAKWLLVALCAAMAAGMILLTAFALTETVAQLDGKARTLVFRRERPWGERREAIAFDDVVDVRITALWLPDGTLRKIVIETAGGRRFNLWLNDRDVAEAEQILGPVRQLLRRPAARTA